MISKENKYEHNIIIITTFYHKYTYIYLYTVSLHFVHCFNKWLPITKKIMQNTSLLLCNCLIPFLLHAECQWKCQGQWQHYTTTWTEDVLQYYILPSSSYIYIHTHISMDPLTPNLKLKTFQALLLKPEYFYMYISSLWAKLNGRSLWLFTLYLLSSPAQQGSD